MDGSVRAVTPAGGPAQTLPAEEMKAWKVSAAVGNVRNNRPELIEHVTD
jgi:hypothetical protein